MPLTKILKLQLDMKKGTAPYYVFGGCVQWQFTYLSNVSAKVLFPIVLVLEGQNDNPSGASTKCI